MSTVAAFPKALEWQAWWTYWCDTIHESEPSVRFLIDATTSLQQTFVTISRLLRRKPDWQTDGWTAEEWGNVIDIVEEKLAWFRTHKPRPDDLPPWGGILLQALDGAYLTLRRLAQEVEQIQRKGHLLINVNPVSPGELAERGEEQS